MKKYFSFFGRTRRTEYWIIRLILSPFHVFLHVISKNLAEGIITPFEGFVFFITVFVVAIWIDSAMIIRRLRDIGISTWFALPMLLIPLFNSFLPFLLLNAITTIILGCIPSVKEATITSFTHKAKEQKNLFHNIEFLKNNFSLKKFLHQNSEKIFPFIIFPAAILFLSYGMFILFIGVFGFSDILENIGLWKIFVYLLTGLAIFLQLFILLAIGAVYWLVNIWDWNIWLAILFVSPAGLLSIALLITMLLGRGISAMFNLIKNNFFNNK